MERDNAAAKAPGVLARLVRVWDRRFVPIMELTGYLLCAMIGAGFAASLWYKVDVAVTCEGTLAAPSVDAAAPAEGVVSEWLAKPGQVLKQGDPICIMDTGKDAEVRGKTRRGITDALSAMRSRQEDQAAEAQLQSILESMGTDSDTRTVVAPEAGILVPTGSASRVELLRQGDMVARLVDAAAIEMEGTAATRSVPPAVGNRASVTVPWSGAALEGQVAKVDSGTPSKVVLRFEALPQPVRDAYLSELQATHLEIPKASCKAKITVGQESLFKSLFGRH